MTAKPSAAPSLIDSLVTIFDGAVDATVLDGPVVDESNRKSWVCVGWDGTKDSDGVPAGGPVGDVDQTWPHVGGFDKQEDGSIVCAAVAWSGGSTYKPVRDAAFDLVSDCEQALRTAFAENGGVVDSVRYIDLRLATGALSQEPISDGVLARVGFTVVYQTWI